MNIDFKVVASNENEYTHYISKQTAKARNSNKPVKLAKPSHTPKAHPTMGSSLSNF